MREINLPDFIVGSAQVEEERLVHPLLSQFKVASMNYRFGAVVRWNIMASATGIQDVHDTVKQPVGVASGPVDVRLCWREIFLDNLPEIIVNFPEDLTLSII